ncbi:FAD dependent oxidoreductase, partial [Saccharata proteae CBS 121410]
LPVPNPTISHWLSEPHPLHNHRSTPDLPAECDVLIIGTGMAGVTTAYHLTEQTSPTPPSILLLEARSTCSGATGRNGGHSKVQARTLTGFLDRVGEETTNEFNRLVHGIIYDLKGIVEREGIECEFELRRSFDVFLDEGDARKAHEAFEQQCKNGCEWVKDISWIDERYAEKITSVRGAAGAFSVPACSLWPYKFCTQLLSTILARHPTTNLQTNTPVHAVTPASSGHLFHVHTPRGTVLARKIIYATNAYTGGLLPSYKPVIVPTKGTAASLAIPESKPPVQPHLSCTYNIDYGGGKVDYFNPRPEGRRIVLGGASWLFRGEKGKWRGVVDDSTLMGEEVERYFERYMQRNFLGWEGSGCERERVWTGIMGSTPDQLPHVGKVPGTSNAWILAGFNGGGMSMIPACAKGVAKMVAEDAAYEDVGLPGFFKTTEERLKR